MSFGFFNEILYYYGSTNFSLNFIVFFFLYYPKMICGIDKVITFSSYYKCAIDDPKYLLILL